MHIWVRKCQIKRPKNIAREKKIIFHCGGQTNEPTESFPAAFLKKNQHNFSQKSGHTNRRQIIIIIWTVQQILTAAASSTNKKQPTNSKQIYVITVIWKTYNLLGRLGTYVNVHTQWFACVRNDDKSRNQKKKKKRADINSTELDVIRFKWIELKWKTAAKLIWHILLLPVQICMSCCRPIVVERSRGVFFLMCALSHMKAFAKLCTRKLRLHLVLK